jgi:long-chain fatty acid transport protein
MDRIRNLWKCSAGLLLGVSLVGNQAQAAGFEKTVMWSGRYGGMAGVAVGNTENSEALFFNPAGLAGAKGFHVTGQFSPTLNQFSGPISTERPSYSSVGFSPIGAATLSYQPIDRLTFGLGYAVTGGTNSEFSNVSWTGLNSGFETLSRVRASLAIHEVSFGAGYGITDELRVGVAYRMTYVSGGLSSTSFVSPIPTFGSALVALDLNNLSDWNFAGFRAGIQYQQRDRMWGVGLNVRTPVDFTARGTSSGTAEAAAVVTTPAAITGGDVTVSNQFPLQVSLGGYVSLFDQKLRILPHYDYTNYVENKVLDINGTFTLPGALSALGTQNISDIAQNW